MGLRDTSNVQCEAEFNTTLVTSQKVARQREKGWWRTFILVVVVVVVVVTPGGPLCCSIGLFSTSPQDPPKPDIAAWLTFPNEPSDQIQPCCPHSLLIRAPPPSCLLSSSYVPSQEPPTKLFKGVTQLLSFQQSTG